MHSFCRTALLFFFSLATAYWLLWKWDNFMAAPISTDNCEISYYHISMLVPWKKEHLQGTINSRARKGEGSYTKPKGNAIQHDCYIVRWWIRPRFVQFTAMVEVFSMDVELNAVSLWEKRNMILSCFLTWDVGWCQGLARYLHWKDVLLTSEECINISICGEKIRVFPRQVQGSQFWAFSSWNSAP